MNIRSIVNSSKIWWFVVFLYMGIIFFLSSIPGKDVPLLFPHSDKLLHLTEYGILGWLLRKALSFSSLKYPGILVVLIGTLYGLSDEIHQIFVPGRDMSIFDLTFDALGTVLAQALFIRSTNFKKTCKMDLWRSDINNNYHSLR